MNKGSVFMTLVMLAIFVAMVGLASQFPPQARFMPMVVGIPGVALCLLQLYLDLRASCSSVPSATAQPADFAKVQGTISGAGQTAQFESGQEPLPAAQPALARAEERRRELGLWAALLGLVAAIVLFGFWLTIPVFLVLFLRYFAATSWRFSLALGVLGTAVLFLVFAQGLGVILHGGFITEQVLDRLSDH